MTGELITALRELTEAVRGGGLSSVSSGQVDIIVEAGKTYRRATHPLLFRVVDLLEGDKAKREWTVRALAAETGVSKSWCAVAKRYRERHGGEEC